MRVRNLRSGWCYKYPTTSISIHYVRSPKTVTRIPLDSGLKPPANPSQVISTSEGDVSNRARSRRLTTEATARNSSAVAKLSEEW